MHLPLTPAQAFFLHAILTRIGGHPDNSARQHTDAILKQLHRMGADYPYNVTQNFLKGSLTFTNYDV